MKVGHPYLTADLDVVRGRQRSVLREIPDWIVSRMDLTGDLQRSSEFDATDAALVESQLRERADLELKNVAAETFARFSAHARMEPLVRALQRESLFGALEEFGDDIHRDYQSKRVQKWPVGPVEEMEHLYLTAGVKLLVLADTFADDGYADPRLQAQQPDDRSP